ncbi:EamA-like transporter family protein [Halalkalicoccus paucihalophilus]|uniref:EamA-like transporter family protein n=1 Tax=Halalkalicoccus paucihalophilus TaxID=1008153 RepID=A0A151AEN9_9EURY|nr:DMT family transporter [Halalkalicoccus paucihalophilus]KYH26158.1 EamA-like transporter family protein [Halalkalicoccus paucihalophilus]
MSLGLVASVLAALLWGSYLFALKRFFSNYSASVIIVVVHSIAIAFYLPVALATVPRGAVGALVAGGPGLATIVVTNSLAFMAFIRAIEAGEISYVAPISKIVPAFVLPIEIVFLGAYLTPIQLFGVALVTLAVYVANFTGGSLLEPIRYAARSRAAGFALLSAALYAVGDVGRRVTLQELALPPGLLVLGLLSGMALVLSPLAVRTWNGIDGDAPKFLAAGLLVAVAEHLTALAFSLVPASVASPIINTQAVVAVVLGGVLLDERAFRTRLIAAALAVCGVGLIAL